MLFLISLIAAALALIIFVSYKKRGRVVEAPFALIGFVVTALIAVMQCFTVIPAGHVGVVDFLGTVSENTLKSGVNFVNPMANVIKFSIKTQEIKESMNVPSKEGLSVQLEISLLFHLNPENAFDIYRSVGENYAEIILAPQFRSVVRGVTARYEAKALYTSERETLAKQIEDELSRLVAKRGITLESAPLRQIILPTGLTTAIEEKLKAEQESQRMQFVLLKEQQEADRKRIEAKGVADFQDIVSKGISEQLLKWKGIEATEKLAGSPNSKIVVIGSGKDGLPLILGGN
ncbi:MAG: prohibitin family protein [Ignavibacteriales bacterium]|jgi:regulator of protease activity HflC (stomatin/prohibitin superfamily)|nr:prohibitin family protein [Ignavibacteriaceae bacterium]NLH60403.1 prohibitin family protein [Ignavibacteriales bacterium]HOJ18852.1 prohibitin family protein [Ignavibacteriaceae bacterium]HPO55703.1 prohibitin family protein [Ignavibacteriaceae bacterium]